jgi:hypothetical protein
MAVVGELRSLVPDHGRPEPLSLAGRLVLVGLGLVTVVLLIASGAPRIVP